MEHATCDPDATRELPTVEQEELKSVERSVTGGSSSSGYSVEYLAAGPAAQRVLQKGLLLQKQLLSKD